ncbi:MAG: XRE family transcriptional regulator [Bdellovibrionales bacterium CG10_big_fil_rev_8_21_14_0_10_45_34]|nr:MAG: XRE family transcriptional regulator [Bdellovibrionales bacterium CG10_big_fil_rev_8_21_14_0_10_45_34]
MKAHEKKLLKLGANIQSWRKRRLMTVEALANKAGISKGNLSDIENGKKDPRYLTLYFIAEALNLKVANLLARL